jgi:CBS domain-containing protein
MLQGLSEHSFPLLSLGVKEYLHRMYGYLKARARYLLLHSILTLIQPAVVCSNSDTVESVVLKLVVHKVHRIFVVSDKLAPVGVISLTDIMQFMLAQQYQSK